MKLFVKKLNGEALLPTRNNKGDAGYDLYSVEDGMLKPGQRRLFKTGISLRFPSKLVFLIKDRSGLAYKKGLTVLAGVVDSGYRGEVGVVLLNTGDEAYEVKRGDRIAQGLLLDVATPSVKEVSSHDDTGRGSAGFGSSGR